MDWNEFNKKKRDEQRESWPERSLEKALSRDFPGSKSLLEALGKVIQSKNPSSPKTMVQRKEPIQVQANKYPPEYYAMRDAINEIARITETVDYWKIPLEVRARILAMWPETGADILPWKEALIGELKKIDGSA